MPRPYQFNPRTLKSGPGLSGSSPMDLFMAFCRQGSLDPRAQLMQVGLSGVILLGSTVHTGQNSRFESTRSLGETREPLQPRHPRLDPHGGTSSANHRRTRGRDQTNPFRRAPRAPVPPSLEQSPNLNHLGPPVIHEHTEATDPVTAPVDPAVITAPVTPEVTLPFAPVDADIPGDAMEPLAQAAQAQAVQAETVQAETGQTQAVEPQDAEAQDAQGVGDAVATTETGTTAANADDTTTLMPSATQGPFREGMRTSFANAPVITEAMASAMNTAYDRLRSYGFNQEASLAWTLHGIHESQGGTILREVGTGDGVGFFQFSIWHGAGAGGEISELPRRGMDRNWERADFLLAEDQGNAATPEQAAVQSVDALVQNLWVQPHYQQLYRNATRPQTSLGDYARQTTRDFIRPGVSWRGRVNGITGTYRQNRTAIISNLEAFEAVRQRPALLAGGIPVRVPMPRPANLGLADQPISTGQADTGPPRYPAENAPAMP
ncbi:MAG: hypothetical protein AAF213_11470 [Pseudomonadota bacterium]